MTAINWSNPYENRRGRWLKGNLHTHSKEGSDCAAMPLKEAIARYNELKYDFICISNHMCLTSPKHQRLMFLSGIEWNSPNGEHTNICSFDSKLLERCTRMTDQPALLARLAKSDAIVILNHPNWCEPAHYSREQLLARKPVLGMEIYNAVVERLAGCSLATDKWDFLLSNDRPILGFASDDAHNLNDIGQGWIMARSQTRSPRAAAKAILEGNFYSSTGVTIRDISRKGTLITIETADADEIWAIGRLGVRIAAVSGRRMSLDVARLSTPYVRFAAFGRGPAMAWTQPFFLNTPPEKNACSPFVTKWFMSGLESHRLGNAPSAGRASRSDWGPVVAKASPPGFVSPSRQHGKKDGVVYFTNRFEVGRTAEWIVSLGHDGGAALFVDGERVIFQPNRINPAVPDRSRARFKFARGAHEITVCLDTDHGKGQGFMFRFVRPTDGGFGARPSDAFPKRLG